MPQEGTGEIYGTLTTNWQLASALCGAFLCDEQKLKAVAEMME